MYWGVWIGSEFHYYAKQWSVPMYHCVLFYFLITSFQFISTRGKVSKRNKIASSKRKLGCASAMHLL